MRGDGAEGTNMVESRVSTGGTWTSHGRVILGAGPMPRDFCSVVWVGGRHL